MNRNVEKLAEAVLAGRRPAQSDEDYDSLCMDAVVDLARAVHAYPHRVGCNETGCVQDCVAAERDFEEMKRIEAERVLAAACKAHDALVGLVDAMDRSGG